MNNDPELAILGKYLGKITEDFVKFSDLLKEASYQLIQRKISDFPIFVISKQNNPIGQLIFDGKKINSEWKVNFSFMEEFIQRELIQKEDEFKQAYKNPEEFCCLFVIDEEFTNFLYIPYPED